MSTQKIVCVLSLALAGCGAEPNGAPGTAAYALTNNPITNTDTQITYSYSYSVGAPAAFQVFIDTQPGTTHNHYLVGGVKANYLIEGGSVYSFAGGSDNTNFAWTSIGTATFSASGGVATTTVSRALLGETNLCGETAEVVYRTVSSSWSTLETGTKIVHNYTPSSTCTASEASNDATNVTFNLPYTGSPAHFQLFIDDLNTTPNAGYAKSGLLADYLIEDDKLWRFTGGSDSGAWSWSQIGTVTFSASAGVAHFTVARSALGETACPNSLDYELTTTAADWSALVASSKHTYAFSCGGCTPETDAQFCSRLHLCGNGQSGSDNCSNARTANCGTCSTGTQTVNYAADSTTVFANPERGTYHQPETVDFASPLSVSTLQGYRASEYMSLIRRIWYLPNERTSALTTSQLQTITNDFNAARAAGMKVIVRFAYSSSSDSDTTPAWVQTHISNLKSVLQTNADVIASVEAGFIGQWGEWASSTNFGGNPSSLSSTELANRRAVVDALLNVLPASRTIQLRRPLYKTQWFGTAALTSAEAFSSTQKARIGHHNDCFVASKSDMGTYGSDIAGEKAYLAAENLYVPQGGETCAWDATYSPWSVAQPQLSAQHWSSLNLDWSPAVLSDQWFYGTSNLDVLRRSLGYRFSLVSGTYSTSVPTNGNLSVGFTVHNYGYAAPYNPRDVKIVLRNMSTSALYSFALSGTNIDPRRWTPGADTTIGPVSVALTGVPAGTYELLLNLSDPAATLNTAAMNPLYAIRLANTNSIWESSTGYNKLGANITVTP